MKPISVFPWVFSDVSAQFRLDRERLFYFELSAAKIEVLSLRRYGVEIEPNYEHAIILFGDTYSDV